jgi:hypothetical protein
MSGFELRQKVAGVLDTCNAMLGVKGRENQPVDEVTLNVAQAILNESKLHVPDDKILGVVSLAPPVTWSALLTAMNLVERSIPLSQARIGRLAGRRGY